MKLSCLETSTALAQVHKRLRKDAGSCLTNVGGGNPFSSMILSAADENYFNGEWEIIGGTMMDNPETQFSCVKEALVKNKKLNSTKP